MELKNKLINNSGFLLAICSAFLYAFNVIIEKKYIDSISSEMILFLMYLGAGIGLYIIHLCTKNFKKVDQNRITKKEIPKIAFIVICELVASFLLIEAVKIVSASLVSLLSVFEIVMTAICGYFMFNNKVSKNEINSIILMAVGCLILNYESGIFSNIGIGSMLVILACLFWGIENNITASISSKEPSFFTSIKCFFVAILYLIIVLFKGTFDFSLPILLIFGFFTYGLSILSYALSTKYIGANRATLFFSFCPIFGVVLSVIFCKDHISYNFLISLFFMIAAIIFLNKKVQKR